MTRILVTGGAGYIGSVLVGHLLKQGYKVRVFDNLSYTGKSLLSAWGESEFEFINGDICDAGLLEKAIIDTDVVVHLAAIVGDPACKIDLPLTKKVNSEASKRFVDELLREGKIKFIFASTCSNYGISKQGDYASEDSPLKPLSAYAESKVEVEKYLTTSRNDFNYTILRFSTAYGVSPRMRFDLTISDFTMQMMTKQYLMVYGKEFWRPYIHIRDIARAIQIVIEKPKESFRQVFNVGDNGENYRKSDIVEVIREFAPLSKVEFNGASQDLRDYRVRFDKINKVLGFYTKLSIRDGVKEVAKLIQNKVINDFESNEYHNA